jgi:hypothetical protein
LDTTTRETVTTRADGTGSTSSVSNTSAESYASVYQTVEYLVYFFFGAIEILLAFRMLLKITGANAGSGFVDFIYSLSNILVYPFEGIFRSGVTKGLETTAVFEPSTLVALLVFPVLAWGIVVLIRVLSGKKQPVEDLIS